MFTFISDICGQRVKTPMSNIDISASIYCWGPLARTRWLHSQLKAQLWAKKPLSFSFSVNGREKTGWKYVLMLFWLCYLLHDWTVVNEHHFHRGLSVFWSIFTVKKHNGSSSVLVFSFAGNRDANCVGSTHLPCHFLHFPTILRSIKPQSTL